MKTLIPIILSLWLCGCYTVQRFHHAPSLTVAKAKAQIDEAYLAGEIDGKALEEAWAAVGRYEAAVKVEKMEVINWKRGPTNSLAQAMINRQWQKGAAISQMLHLLSNDRAAHLKGL